MEDIICIVKDGAAGLHPAQPIYIHCGVERIYTILITDYAK